MSVTDEQPETERYEIPRLWETPFPGDWIDRALCASIDPERWFPEQGSDGGAAKKVCADCPVLAECRDYALQHPVLVGVWAGTTDRERRKIRKRQTT